MKNIKKVGASKVSRLTFLLVFIFLVIILLTRSCFNDYKAIETNEEVSTLIRQKKISNNGKIDVNQERYYYDLGLLDEKILPEIYQQNDIEDIYLAENQVNVFESNYFNQNIDINVFDDISLNVDFNKIQQNIQKANLISQKSDEQSSITKEEEFKDLTVEEKSIENTDLIEDDFSDEDLFADEEFDEEFDEDLFADEEFDDDFFGDEEFDDNFFDGGFANDLGTPFEPILFPPFIQTQEEYDLFNPSETEENQTDDDFFSDFYIAGESDQALFDDGIYYLTLFVNGDRVGDVETKFEGSTYSIGSNSLYENVSGLLSDYGIQRLFNNGIDYYTIEELQELGVGAEIDVVAFEVYLEFDVNDMPLQYLPVSKIEKNSLIQRNEKYGISDALVLTPSKLSAVSTINLSSSFTYGDLILNPYSNNSIYMNNQLNIGKVSFNFSNSFTYDVDTTTSIFQYDFSTWEGTYYFRDKNLKLNFGNVGSYLGNDGIPVGFTLEKNYSYGVGEELKHQFTKRYLLEADSIMYIYMNEDEEIVKNLRKGEYILQDFPLDQGANHVKIKIVPNDKSFPIILDDFDIPYDSRLLASGDYLYGFSAAFSKSERSDDSTSLFRLPYFDLKWYDYDLLDLNARLYLNVGLSHYFTLNSSFALSSDEFKTTFSGVLATMSGPFSGNLSLDFKLDYSPTISASISHTIDTFIGDISATLNLDLPVWDYSDNSLHSASEIELSLGHSYENTFGPPLTTSINAIINEKGLGLSASFSSNYTPVAGVNLTSSLNVNKEALSNNLDFSLQLGVGLTIFNDLTTSKSISSEGSSSLSVSYKPSNQDSLQFNIGGLQYFESASPVYNLYWQHVDTYYSLLLKHNISNELKAHNTSASISSALYYADGLFAISQAAASNFIIIKPQGEFANNPISIGKTNSSNLEELSPLFGNVVYTKLAANARNNLIMYGTTESLYSSGASFSYEVNPTTSSGFSQKISSPVTYTVSGVLLKTDKTPFEQYSSPIYNVIVDENGVESLQTNEELYLFTDVDGRFILSDVVPGTYLFDMTNENNKWYGLYFIIKEDFSRDKKVVLLEEYQLPEQNDLATSFEVVSDEDATSENVFGDAFASDYIDILELKVEKFEDEQTFWDVIFPPIDEESDDFAFEDTASDWQEALDETTEFDQDIFEEDPAFSDTADDWQETLGEELIETVVKDDTKQENPNYTYVP